MKWIVRTLHNDNNEIFMTFRICKVTTFAVTDPHILTLGMVEPAFNMDGNKIPFTLSWTLVKDRLSFKERRLTILLILS